MATAYADGQNVEVECRDSYVKVGIHYFNAPSFEVYSEKSNGDIVSRLPVRMGASMKEALEAVNKDFKAKAEK